MSGGKIQQNLFVSRINGQFGVKPNGAATQTSNGYVENSIFGCYLINNADTITAKFDFTNSRNGSPTINLTTNATGKGRIVFGLDQGTLDPVSASSLKSNATIIKPNTQYTVSGYIKYTNLVSTTLAFTIHEYNVDGNRTSQTLDSATSGTSDWTLKSITFTSKPTTKYLVIGSGIGNAGIQSFNVDVNSIKITEISSRGYKNSKSH